MLRDLIRQALIGAGEMLVLVGTLVMVALLVGGAGILMGA